MKKIIASLIVLAPSVAFAQRYTDFSSTVTNLSGIANTILGVLIAFAFIYIVFNIVRFIMSDAEKRAEIRMSIVWGIVGLAVIASIWGLVKILTNTFSVDNSRPSLPVIQVDSHY